MQPQQPYQVPPPQQPAPNYDFILSPAAPPKRRPLGGGSMLSRLLLVGGILVVLMIVFVVIKNLASGPSNYPVLLTVAQDQQELIHLSTAAGQQQTLATAAKNFATTAQFGLTSQQAQFTDYLKKNGHHVPAKTLNLKISKTTDDQLAAAASAGTYGQTFKEVMQSQLTTYSQDLKRAYAQTTGRKGRQLLSNDYDAAQLLLQQLSSPQS